MLRDRILENPGSFAVGCFAWVPLLIWVLALVRWMINGDVDIVFGILGIFVAFVLGFVAMVPPIPQLSFLTFVAIAGTVVLFPVVRATMERRSLKAFEIEDLQRAYDALHARPDNVVARFRIAKKAFDLGFPGHAIRIAEACIRQMPDAFFKEEHNQLRKWGRLAIKANAFEPLKCTECGHPNPPGDVHCGACGAPFLLHRAKGKVLPTDMGKKLMAGWIVMVVALAGVPLVASIGGVGAAIGIFAMMIVAIAVLVLAFWQRDNGVQA